MNSLLSRYGGQLFMITETGLKKPGIADDSEDQSFDHVMKNKATPMQGFTYLSSYDHLYNFMGPYGKLSPKSVKLCDIEHVFLELNLQYDVNVTTSVYLGYTGFSNLFCLYIKTDFRPLELLLDKMESTYDLVIIVRVLGKTNDEIKQSMDKIATSMIGLLLYEMEIWDTDFDVIPSKTYLGKKLNTDLFRKMVHDIKEVKNKEQLAELIKI